jgi:hypothetical protein
MNSDQNNRTNRDQDEMIKRSKSGVSPTTQAANEQTDHLARSRRDQVRSDSNRSASSRATDAARRGDPLPAKDQSERSPKQENL